MLVISDSNIIFSALIRPNGTIASIINAKRKFKIIAPDFLLDEVYKHFDEILINSDIDEKSELNTLITLYKTKIDFISVNEIPKRHRLHAYELVCDIDVDDVAFVALSLYKQCNLWTTDKILANGLRKKGFTKIITTTELKKYLYKK